MRIWLVATVFFIGGQIPAMALQSYAGYIYFLSGSVEKSLPAEQNTFVPLKPKDLIVDGQIIKTAEDGSALLVLRDGSAIKLFGATMIQLNSLSEGAKRQFSLDLTLDYGAVSALVSQNIEELAVRVSTYVISNLKNGCFAASNDPDLGLTRIKSADIPFSISEGLSESKLRPRQIFVRFEKAFAFTSKSLSFLPQRIALGVDDYVDSAFSVSVQLAQVNLLKIVKASYPINIIAYPYFIFGYAAERLDEDGYLFLRADLSQWQASAIVQSLSCFEVDDVSQVFSFATGVLRGFEAVNY